MKKFDKKLLKGQANNNPKFQCLSSSSCSGLHRTLNQGIVCSLKWTLRTHMAGQGSITEQRRLNSLFPVSQMSAALWAL